MHASINTAVAEIECPPIETSPVTRAAVATKIPSLDGLRAVAILCVIVSHWSRQSAGAWSLGHFGVITFFVISGYLITRLMLREREKTGDVSIKRFYQRRALRILPAYLLFLSVIGALAVAHVYRITGHSWLGALTYTSCFFTLSMAPVLAHTWSLSVEEHFYLVWPVLFRWCSAGVAMVILVLVVVLTPFLRWHAEAGWRDPNYSSLSQMSSIAIGCLLAFVLSRGMRVSWIWSVGALSLFVLSFVARRPFPNLQVALCDTARAAGVALLIGVILELSPANILYRTFNSRGMVQIGVLSYGLYLWQQPLTEEHVPVWLGVPVLGTVAFLSYQFVELPFLRLKEKLNR